MRLRSQPPTPSPLFPHRTPTLQPALAGQPESSQRGTQLHRLRPQPLTVRPGAAAWRRSPRLPPLPPVLPTEGSSLPEVGEQGRPQSPRECLLSRLQPGQPCSCLRSSSPRGLSAAGLVQEPSALLLSLRGLSAPAGAEFQTALRGARPPSCLSLRTARPFKVRRPEQSLQVLP